MSAAPSIPPPPETTPQPAAEITPRPAPPNAGPPSRLRALRALRSLRSRNYRLFFTGQSISLVGTWVTRIATSWLVYQLTGSAWWLGVVGFVGLLPTLVVAPVAGVLVDRWDRHRVLLVTQALSLLQSAALAALAFTHTVTVAHILWLQLVQGLVNALDTPARQAFVVEMVDDRADLPNAIALNSSMFNGTRVVGPAVGGALLAAAGAGWCFALDAVSYVAVIASLFLMHLPARAGAPPTRGLGAVLAELREGVRYAAGFPPVRSLLVLVGLLGVFGMPYTTLMPEVASRVLHGGPHLLGWLMTAGGVGALGGAVYLAGRTTVVGLGRVIAAGGVAVGLALVAFSFARTAWLALALLTVVGGTFMMTTAACNTILQTILPEALRGRVMALYTVAFLGTAPIGSLLAGTLAARIGTPWTICAGAVGCLLAGIWFATERKGLAEYVRPIYVEQGILEVQDGEVRSGRA
ncbi:MFS transporter [Gemmatimonadetes bacterium T265]|nr:MFS transporter [Gemmatimonadetes bacterium T265]